MVPSQTDWANVPAKMFAVPGCKTSWETSAFHFLQTPFLFTIIRLTIQVLRTKILNNQPAKLLERFKLLTERQILVNFRT